MLANYILYLLVIRMSLSSCNEDIPSTPHCYQSDSDFYQDAQQSDLDVEDVVRSSAPADSPSVPAVVDSTWRIDGYSDNGKLYHSASSLINHDIYWISSLIATLTCCISYLTDVIFFRSKYIGSSSDEGTDHILLIPQPGTEIEVPERGLDLRTNQSLAPSQDVSFGSSSDVPIVLDWQCSRCNCRPNTQPVVYGELQFCYSCCLRCPNCFLMVPLGSTYSYLSTYLCTICNLAVNDINFQGLVLATSYDEDRDFPKNNILAVQYARQLGLGQGYLVDVATAAAKTGNKKRTLGPKKSTYTATHKPFITPRHRE